MPCQTKRLQFTNDSLLSSRLLHKAPGGIKFARDGEVLVAFSTDGHSPASRRSPPSRCCIMRERLQCGRAGLDLMQLRMSGLGRPCWGAAALDGQNAATDLTAAVSPMCRLLRSVWMAEALTNLPFSHSSSRLSRGFLWLLPLADYFSKPAIQCEKLALNLATMAVFG